MSLVSLRIGPRYKGIIDYFHNNPFGTNPPNMTVLSLLPPVDRCLILEQLVCGCTSNRIDVIDKLSMAYLKAGWRDVANEFLDICFDLEWLNEAEYVFFVEKIRSLLIHDVSENYAATLEKLPCYACEDVFESLIRSLCENYAGKEVLAGMADKGEAGIVAMKQFKDERRRFIHTLKRK